MSGEIAAEESGGRRKRRHKSQAAAFFRQFVANSKAAVGLTLFVVFVILAAFAPVIAPYNPLASQFLPMQAPSAQHLMGTTNTGEDIFSQFVMGARTTMMVGVGAGLLSTVIALAVGMYAGYRGGALDSFLSVFTNLFLVLPSLALLIVIESYVHNSTPIVNGVIIGFTGWAWGARVFRAQTLSLGHREFVVAARLSGKSTLGILATEILPNMISVVATNIMYSCLAAILAESGLAYLGMENLSSMSWGTMLYWADSGGALLNGAWWWFVPPGLGIALVGTSFALMNFAVDQITNPRLRIPRRRRVRRGKQRASA